MILSEKVRIKGLGCKLRPALFCWPQNRGVFVAGYGLDFISLRDLTEKYKLTQYKMAEFKDVIPILIHLFEVDKYRFCK